VGAPEAILLHEILTADAAAVMKWTLKS